MRLISRIDVKNDYVIKGIHLEGLRKVGNPNEFAQKYYAEGIDEIVFMDAVASLYDRNNLFHVIKKAAEVVFIPITLGGGIRTIDDISLALNAGADKIAVNTGAVKKEGLISEAAKKFGTQCIVASIEAKLNPKMKSGWEAYIDSGREKTGKDVVEWATKVEKLGAGEILLTSVDMEGTKRGFDNNLFHSVNEATTIPVVISGGFGKLQHFDQVINDSIPNGIALASVLHYNIYSIEEIKSYLAEQGVKVRAI